MVHVFHRLLAILEFTKVLLEFVAVHVDHYSAFAFAQSHLVPGGSAMFDGFMTVNLPVIPTVRYVGHSTLDYARI
jgi:hypothetical protein